MYSIESTLSAIVWFRPYIREHPSKLDSCFSSLSTAYVSGGRFIIIILILSQSLLITKSCLPWSCVYLPSVPDTWLGGVAKTFRKGIYSYETLYPKFANSILFIIRVHFHLFFSCAISIGCLIFENRFRYLLPFFGWRYSK